VPTEYRLRRRVQFYETDAAGIVHFSVYFRYFEEAEHALWRAAGLSIAAPGADVGWPRVSAAFEYHRPLRFEEEFDITVRVAELTRRTNRYACAITRDGDAIATGTIVIVCVRADPDGRLQASPLPSVVVERLSGDRGDPAS
jgi:4-hydroxybenzoyl-CoA thioesterase/acyl-CoA thioester hydrolase